MRISDWSSDVCSSDLAEAAVAQAETQARRLATEVERLERERGALDTDSDSAARLAGAERATAGLTRDIERWTIELAAADEAREQRSEEHTSELQSLMRNSYDVLCLKNKQKQKE